MKHESPSFISGVGVANVEANRGGQGARRLARVGAVCAIALVAIGCKGKAAPPAAPPPPREIEALTIELSEVRDTGEYLGSLLSRGNVTVLPQVAGYVRAVLVKPGQKVAAGAPLLDVDAREESAALASAQAQQAAAQANLGLAQQVRERTESLYKEGLATAEELDQRRASVAAADAAARAAKAQVTQRQVAVQFFSVRAPVAGVVGDVLVRVGDRVTTATRATTISQAGALEVSIAVPALRARAVTVGTPVEILSQDGAVQLVTQVFFISPDADPVTQLVELKASVPPSEGFRSSERIRTRVIYSTGKALQVPARAVVRQSGQAFVFRIADKGGKQVVERRPVELGELGMEAFVLQKGLESGDRIAVSSIQQLRDGAAVKLKPPSAAVKEEASPAAPASAPPAAPPAAPASAPASAAPNATGAR